MKCSIRCIVGILFLLGSATLATVVFLVFDTISIASLQNSSETSFGTVRLWRAAGSASLVVEVPGERVDTMEPVADADLRVQSEHSYELVGRLIIIEKHKCTVEFEEVYRIKVSDNRYVFEPSTWADATGGADIEWNSFLDDWIEAKNAVSAANFSYESERVGIDKPTAIVSGALAVCLFVVGSVLIWSDRKRRP